MRGAEEELMNERTDEGECKRGDEIKGRVEQTSISM